MFKQSRRTQYDVPQAMIGSTQGVTNIRCVLRHRDFKVPEERQESLVRNHAILSAAMLLVLSSLKKDNCLIVCDFTLFVFSMDHLSRHSVQGTGGLKYVVDRCPLDVGVL